MAITNNERKSVLAKLRLLVIITIVFIAALGAHPTRAEPTRQVEFHIVEEGETWVSISAKFVVPVQQIWLANGVTNTALLQEGQRLFIPNANTQQSGQVVTSDGAAGLVWAAYQSGTHIASVQALNIDNSGYFLPGQLLAIPPAGLVTAEVTPVPNVENTPVPVTDMPTPLPGGTLRRSLMGIQGHFLVEDDQRNTLLDDVAYNLGFGWVKFQVDWSQIEYGPDQYSVYLDELDKAVHGAYQRNLKILLSVVKAPDWARSSTEADGPPSNYNDYYDFLRFIVGRYTYNIAAVEVWNEPNLRREWSNAQPLSGGAYVELLKGAYQAIKETNGGLTVVSAGLAPTGVNSDEAKSDRLYFREMYEAGVGQYADAIGIHPYGWANPPWTRCCQSPSPTHNNDPTFYFLDTVEDYREIQVEFGDEGHQMWATEFGWGSMDGLDMTLPDEQPFFAYVSQDQQAQYILEAYRLGQQWSFMGPMFLWNLNMAALHGADPNQAGYGILGQSMQPRAAYNVLREIAKSDD